VATVEVIRIWIRVCGRTAYSSPAEFAAHAHIKSLAEYEASTAAVSSSRGVLGRGRRRARLFAPWTKVTEGEAQHANGSSTES